MSPGKVKTLLEKGMNYQGRKKKEIQSIRGQHWSHEWPFWDSNFQKFAIKSNPRFTKVLPCIPGTCLIPVSLRLYFFLQEEKSFEAFSGAGQSLRKKGRRWAEARICSIYFNPLHDFRNWTFFGKREFIIVSCIHYYDTVSWMLLNLNGRKLYICVNVKVCVEVNLENPALCWWLI